MKYPRGGWTYRNKRKNIKRDNKMIEMYENGFRWKREKVNDYVRSLIRN